MNQNRIRKYLVMAECCRAAAGHVSLSTYGVADAMVPGRLVPHATGFQKPATPRTSAAQSSHAVRKDESSAASPPVSGWCNFSI